MKASGDGTIITERLKKRQLLRATPGQVLLLGFAAIILTGAVLLTLPAAVKPGGEINFLNSLFTATSAVCVTGLIVVDTATHWTLFGQIVILSLIQVGGLGFMTMGTFFAVLLGRQIGLRQRLIIQESLNQTDVAGIVRLTRYVLLFTLITEFIFGLILAARWSVELGWQKGLWFGLFHSISAFNNAGFDIFGGFRSLTMYTEDLCVTLCISTAIILGGLGFAVNVDLLQYFRGAKKRFSLHTKLVLFTTAFLIAAGTVMFFFLEYDNTLQNLSPAGKVMASYFQAVSPRTAGFNTLDLGALHSATQFFVIILMFIGASPGSTGGGIKTTTFASLLVYLCSMVRGKRDFDVFNRRLGQELINKAVTILLLCSALVVSVSLLLSITERADFLSILFETTSAFATVGLTMGLTTKLSAAGKVVLILTMYLGRLGPLTVAFAMARQKRKTLLHYPEEKINVG